MLAAPTREDVLAKQEADSAAQRKREAERRALDRQAQQDEDRKRIAQASVQAADTFELGQDPLASLTGQQDIFSAAQPGQQAQGRDEPGPLFSRSVASTAKADGQWQASLRQAASNPQAKEPSMATPMVLQMMGASAPRLVLPRTYLKAILDKHPDVPAVVFERLPEMLADPLFILPHQQGGLRVILQTETARGEPVAVGVSVGADGRIQTITAMNDSAEATGQQRVARAVVRAQGRIYARNKEALDNARASAAAAPGLIPLRRGAVSASNVVTRADVVKKIEAGDGPRYSRSTQDAAPLTQRAAQAVVVVIKARWANAPEVVVVESMQDERVPNEVRDYDAKRVRALNWNADLGAPTGSSLWPFLAAAMTNKKADLHCLLEHHLVVFQEQAICRSWQHGPWKRMPPPSSPQCLT